MSFDVIIIHSLINLFAKIVKNQTKQMAYSGKNQTKQTPFSVKNQTGNFWFKITHCEKLNFSYFCGRFAIALQICRNKIYVFYN